MESTGNSEQSQESQESPQSQPILLQSLQGTRDFYPEDMAIRNWLFGQFRHTSKLYGYSEYDAPILEPTNLYTRKGGDDILKEMYAFTTGEGTSVCLRPEMTPSVARMVMATWRGAVTPMKLFSIPQCWRFETTTRGRKREHYQWNVDIFGAEKIKSEFEILSMIIKFFKQIGLTNDDVVIKISNRMILQKVLTNLNVETDKLERTFNIIDKIKKVTHEELSAMLMMEIGISQEAVDTIVSLTKITDISELRQFVGDNDETLNELMEIFALMKNCGFDSWLQFDASIVRGLSYYTGMVFEGFFKNSTLQRSICGGGRYDNLLQKYGYNESVPAVGFGFGDVVIIDVLAELGKLPQLNLGVDYCVIYYSEDLYPAACVIAEKIRDQNKTVTLHIKCERLRLAFAYADTIGAEYAILVAPDEFSKNQIVVKNLRTKTEKERKVGIDEYIDTIRIH